MADRAYTLDNPQTLEEFLAKYAGALDSQGRFIDGKANLNYDGMSAADVYKAEMGGYTIPGFSDGYTMDTGPGAGTFVDPKASVNADWIQDPRAKGWMAQHPGGTKMLSAIATMVGGGALLNANSGGAALAGSEAGMLTGGVGGEAFATNAAYDAAMQQAIAAGAVGSVSSGLGSGFSGATSGLGSELVPLTPGTIGNSAVANVVAGTDAAGKIALATSNGAMTLAQLSAATGLTASEIAAAGGMTSGSVIGGTSAAGGLLDAAKGIARPVVDGVKGLNDLTGGNLGAIAGGLLGAAAGGDTKTEATSQKDPWGPAQQYLKDNLKTNAAMQAQYAANPFSDQQKAAYQNSFNNSDNFRNNVAPGLLNMVNSFQPYQRQQTAVGGGYKPAAQTGLLSPNMQAPQGQSIGQVDWSQFLPRG